MMVTEFPAELATKIENSIARMRLPMSLVEAGDASEVDVVLAIYRSVLQAAAKFEHSLEAPRKKILNNCPKLLGLDWFSTEKTRAVFEKRLLGNTSSSGAPSPAESGGLYVPILGTTERIEAMPIVCGESGSGKSTFLLQRLRHSEHALLGRPSFGVYLTVSDFETWAETVEPNDQRNAAAVANLVNAIQKAVGDACLGWMREDREQSLIIVAVDEVGTSPVLLRALCAISSTISATICSKLQIPSPSKTSFRLIVAGTGSDTLSAEPGSLPETYKLLKIPPGRVLWDKKLEQLRDSSHGGVRYLADALSKSTFAGDLGQNPRMTMLLCAAAQRLGEAIPDLRSADAEVTRRETDVGRSHLATLFTAAARQFKELNGVQSVNTAEALEFQMIALQAYFGGPVSETDRRFLCGRLGILTDEGRWVRNQLVVPTSGRFGMSATQMALFRLQYGAIVMPSDAWETFELAAAAFAQLALIGCRSRTVGALLKILGAPPEIISAKELASVTSTPGLSFNAVSSFTSPIQLFDRKGREKPLYVDVMQLVNQSSDAFVILNAPCAPFADIIVLVPRAFVLLIQCKFFSPSTAFTAADVDEELKKMSDVDRQQPTKKSPLITALRKAAGLGNDGPVVRAIFLSTSRSAEIDAQLQAAALKHPLSYVWTNVKFAPLGTPKATRSPSTIDVDRRMLPSA